VGTPKEAIAEAASSTVRRRGSRLTLASVLASCTRTSWAWLQADLYDTTAGDLEHPDCATRSFSEEHTPAASYSPLILGRFHIKLRCLLGRCPNKLTAGSSDLKSGRAAESHRISCNRRRKILITDKLIVLPAKRAFPPTWRVLDCGKRVWKRQNNSSRHLRHRIFRLQVLGFPCPRPCMYPVTMCRFEVWVAALNLIEAHSHTPSSF
jgi:hypothetical protein